MDFRVISIGTLAQNPHWGEKAPVRTGHATTTLITAGKRRILVDPGLPEAAIIARLHERAGLRVSDITDIFLTSFSPDTRRGILAFKTADWWISEQEREAVGVPLARQLGMLAQQGVDPDVKTALETSIGVLRRCKPAPERLADKVVPFPMPGVTPGLTGLLLEHPRFTALVCGDAVPTVEHLERGQVPDWAADVRLASESFAEAIEIADVLICGRDNAVSNPTKRAF
jgi:glyoxylase-like metal-dependent hydrolase (beta-lactamase superfamily II)